MRDDELAPRGAATEAAIASSAAVASGAPPATSAVRDDVVRPRERERSTAALALAAVGVVFGDIGTNPLFVMRAAFGREYGIAPSPADVYGVLSLITWSLLLVVTVKYVSLIMRAQNRGEGGILALLALLLPDLGRVRRPGLWIAAGLAGTALLYGDGVITPAISVLSAVEGLRVATDALAPLVLPLTAAIIVGLFLLQPRGTGRIGRLFGPVMVLWFLVLGALGVRGIAGAPRILAALSPWYAASFFAAHGWSATLVLGAVILAVAGAEALYADVGHFGAAPIRLVWIALVLPCLLLQYFGQGALLLRDPRAAADPFFLLAPHAVLYPLVVLATVATVIASQALITGAFSLTRQLMHLGYSPLLTVAHTSRRQEGQVYIPQVNHLLMVACLLLVLGFRSSERLAAAYGLAVSGTMVLTTLLFHRVMRVRWGWSRPRAAIVGVTFLVVDLAFLVANLAKIPHGGWVPLVIAGAVYFVCATWKRGREILLEIRRRAVLPLDEFFARLERERPCRTPGTGVFVVISLAEAPSALRHHLEQIHALHETVVLLAVLPVEVDRVPRHERIGIERLPLGFVRVTARYGYMQSVDLKDVLLDCAAAGVPTDPEHTTYYIPHSRLRPTGTGRMARWRKRVFIFLHRNAPLLQDFFALPPRKVVELGALVEM